MPSPSGRTQWRTARAHSLPLQPAVWPPGVMFEGWSSAPLLAVTVEAAAGVREVVASGDGGRVRRDGEGRIGHLEAPLQPLAGQDEHADRGDDEHPEEDAEEDHEATQPAPRRCGGGCGSHYLRR